MGKLLRFPRRGKKKDAGAKPLFPGLIPGSTDARPAYFASDASATPDSPRTTEEGERERKLKRRRLTFAVLFSAIFASGSLVALFAERGYFDVRRQRALLAAKTAEVEAQQEQVQALKREVEKLQKEPRAIERIAREDLGYADEGELLLLLPSELDATSRSAIVGSVPSSPAP